MLSWTNHGTCGWLHFLLFLICFPIANVSAQSPDDERARVHFVAGNAYFEAEQWDDAAREFEQAHELSGRPEMLINLSRAHERGGRLREAISDLTLLLERYPKTAYKAEAEQRIANMRVLLGEDAEPEPLPPVVMAAQEPAPAPAQKPQAPANERGKIWPPRLPTFIAGGTTLALGVSALVTGLVAHAQYTDLDAQCPDGVCSARYADEKERGQRLARTSTGLSFAALTMASATAVLWFLDVRASSSSAGKDWAKLDLRFGTEHAEARYRLAF